jgi:hypothetical protein
LQAKDGVPGRATQSEESREAAVAAARSASAKQAEGVAILDVHGLIVITDFFVIASGETDRQVRTIVEEVEKTLRDLGRRGARVRRRGARVLRPRAPVARRPARRMERERGGELLGVVQRDLEPFDRLSIPLGP